MKITEYQKNADGEIIKTEHQIALNHGRPGIYQLLFPSEEPFVIKIIKSGWKDEYHVIEELGDYGTSNYEMLHQTDLLKKFPEFRKVLDMPSQDVLITSDEVEQFVDDVQLGEYVRKKSFQSSSNNSTGQLQIQF